MKKITSYDALEDLKSRGIIRHFQERKYEGKDYFDVDGYFSRDVVE